MKSLLGAGVAAALALAASSHTAHAGDPNLEYFTLESDHFVIHYYAPLEPVARRVAVCAERAYRTLVPALDHVPKDKTLIVLVDDTDSANGFGSVLPRNQINLFATAPPSFSELDDYDDWLYGLVAHEFTHILHLDTMSGLPNIYNRIFGKTWSPNQVMPRWIIEGIAVYEESKRSSGGRNRGTRFDQFIRVARHENRDLRLDEVSGAPRQFPRGNAIYVYGSHFLRYVFDRYGDDAARQMSHLGGAYPIPYAVNRSIAKAIGRPFTELYDDWKGYVRDRYGMQEMAAERRGLVTGRALTHSAETNFWARYTPDGRELVWIQSDGYDHPKVRAMPTGGTVEDARDVVQIDAMGPFDILADGSLVYEQGGINYRRDYSFQDLFRYDARTKATVRLSSGARARDPSVSPDGRRVAFAMNAPTGSTLGIMDTTPGATPTVAWHGELYDQVYQPAWSPDGKRIAFSLWKKGGGRDIVLVDVTGSLTSGKAEFITRDRAIDMFPAWSADGKTLYFDSDRSGISNIYALDLADRSLWQVTNVLGGAFHGVPSPDGKRLAYSAAVAKGGYDLYEVPIDRGRWLPARVAVDDRPPSTEIRDDDSKVSAPRPYRALETLSPQSYTAQIAFGAAPQLSIQTAGVDAMGLHSYSLALGTQLDNGDLDIGAVYAYGGWRMNPRFAMSRTIGTRGGFRIDGVPTPYREEDWSWTLSSNLPTETRPNSSWTLSFDYDVDWFRLAEAPKILQDPNMRTPIIPLTDYFQAGIGSRLAYSRVRNATYAVGPSFGFDASLSVRLDHPLLGATYRNMTLTYAFDAFQRLWGKTPVASLRWAGGFRAGDLVRTGSFALGGTPGQDVVQALIDQTRVGFSGFLRGYAPRTVAGNQFHLMNFEYRQELWQIEHGLSTLPLYLRRITIAGLSDLGTAFDNTFDAGKNFRFSVGGSLRLDTFLGYFVPSTFEVGYARGLVGPGINETWFLLTGSL
jgi:Tol biopolymer transport system component